MYIAILLALKLVKIDQLQLRSLEWKRHMSRGDLDV